MKKFFTVLAAIMISAAAFTFVSCGDDSNDPTPEPTPTPAQTGTAYGVTYIISETMAQYGDWYVIIKEGSDSTKYNIVKEGKAETYDSGKGYSFTKEIDATTKTVSVYTVFEPNAACKALTADTDIDFFCGWAYAKGEPGKLSYNIRAVTFSGVPGDKIAKFYADKASTWKF